MVKWKKIVPAPKRQWQRAINTRIEEIVVKFQMVYHWDVCMYVCSLKYANCLHCIAMFEWIEMNALCFVSSHLFMSIDAFFCGFFWAWPLTFPLDFIQCTGIIYTLPVFHEFVHIFRNEKQYLFTYILFSFFYNKIISFHHQPVSLISTSHRDWS